MAYNGIGLFQKKKTKGLGGGGAAAGGWGHGISRGIKEIACGISRSRS